MSRATSPISLVVLWLTQAVLCAQGQTANSAETFVWHNARDLTVEGKGWNDTQSFYDRLPARAEPLVTRSVWGLSHNSAGLCVRFVTDGTVIAARWTLRSETLAMPHMPASGVSGVDLYVMDKGRCHWLGAGRPSTSRTNEAVLIRGLNGSKREFMLYLPLYNGVYEVEVGVVGGGIFDPTSPRPAKVKPIVFYGTSIVQGGCAARPGMAYPAILGRHLDSPTINLGFSGSARCEPELARIFAELDPAVYVLDPLPNMSIENVATRLEPFVMTLRQAHPRTPIILVENLEYPAGKFVTATSQKIDPKNAKLREIHRRLVRAGQKRIYLFRSDKFIGDDGEATVDGVHPTDLGFMRMAEALEPVLQRALKGSR